MRSRLWIINSALIALFVIVVLILVIGRPTFVVPKNVAFVTHALPTRAVAIPSGVDQIYANDPFGTLGGTRILEQAVPQKPTIPALPPLPVMQPEVPPQTTIPAFLPPLTVSLKGIIYAYQEHDHRAIIEDKKTKRENLYRVGDTILDAEIIRIESNKVMFLRSNGQQETVYVSSAEAHKDPMYQRAEGKNAAVVPVKKVSETQFIIDPHLFVVYVNNLAQFFDALDITTVFENGRSIGCRIGAMAPHSIGVLCGLQSGDIVTSINDIATGTTKERLAIYQQIVSMRESSAIKVTLLRGEQRKKITITYTLAFPPPKQVISPQPQVAQAVQPTQQEIQNFLKQASPVPPYNNGNNTEKVAEKMRKNDKRAMVNYGGNPRAQRSKKW